MNIRKKLTNPFALIAQGFVAGAILFFGTMAPAADSRDTAQAARAADSRPA